MFDDLKAYMSSLEKMSAQAKGRAYPGHGAVVEDCKGKILEYIKHRQQRENEVLRVLKYGVLDGPANEDGSQSQSQPQPQAQRTWTPIEIVKVIYRDVPENLHLPASHGVNLVLQKLESDGKAVHDAQSGGWSLNTKRPAL